ncbi:MAG TPA: FumA C-terminus/TtdB family hydratase beta subunit [bacterium]|nr:FumA C-terminus/TtdB family hydratase beta subunit [bacterium]HPP30540.1 FumA C-terminus/TtdB family hydratase beta subunit [bacterium]
MKQIQFPLKTGKEIELLKTGDEVEISGIIYVARDAAHKKLIYEINNKIPLPFPLKNNLIYYMGPSPTPEGKIIGSCGPTTSSRMDRYTIPLLQAGIKATMGKGERNEEIVSACKRYRAVYFITYGGCGAYLSKFVKKVECIAYPELEPEAIYKLEVEKFPAIVAIDTKGNNLYNK